MSLSLPFTLLHVVNNKVISRLYDHQHIARMTTLQASASWDDVFAATMATMYGRPVTSDGGARWVYDEREQKSLHATNAYICCFDHSHSGRPSHPSGQCTKCKSCESLATTTSDVSGITDDYTLQSLPTLLESKHGSRMGTVRRRARFVIKGYQKIVGRR